MSKGHTTISIDPTLVEILKAMKINISKECENHLWGLVGFKNSPGYNTEKFKLQKLAEIKQKELEDYQKRIAEVERKEKERAKRVGVDNEIIRKEEEALNVIFTRYRKTRNEIDNPYTNYTVRRVALNEKLANKLTSEEYFELLKKVENESGK